VRIRAILLLAIGGSALRPLMAEPSPVLVADLNPKPAVGGPISDLYAVGGQIFFLGTDITHGEELWRSDGTSEGTRLVKDVVAGSESSGVRMLGRPTESCFLRSTQGGSAGFGGATVVRR